MSERRRRALDADGARAKAGWNLVYRRTRLLVLLLAPGSIMLLVVGIAKDDITGGLLAFGACWALLLPNWLFIRWFERRYPNDSIPRPWSR